MVTPLPPSFYQRPTERVARDLLGCVLETTVGGVTCRAQIVETEAYVGEHDAACHAAHGRTPRTEILYGPPGLAYVYFVYGMHWCMNAVTRREGLPGAVLIRAVEPLDGIEAMRARRGPAGARDVDIANGPAKLCDAMGITGRFNGASLMGPFVRILEGVRIPRKQILVTPRIGVADAADWPLRFLVADSQWTSARAATARFLRDRW
ncbi:MAG: DNA-3-methyladenine glycosylase [Gemmatimonadaceae bacterium]|nr:DNA-3-methyladenine glycosylase [Gemmatimonadaceae bacterium]